MDVCDRNARDRLDSTGSCSWLALVPGWLSAGTMAHAADCRVKSLRVSPNAVWQAATKGKGACVKERQASERAAVRKRDARKVAAKGGRGQFCAACAVFSTAWVACMRTSGPGPCRRRHLSGGLAISEPWSAGNWLETGRSIQPAASGCETRGLRPAAFDSAQQPQHSPVPRQTCHVIMVAACDGDIQRSRPMDTFRGHHITLRTQLLIVEKSIVASGAE